LSASLAFSPSVSIFSFSSLSLSLSLSLKHTHTHTHTRARLRLLTKAAMDDRKILNIQRARNDIPPTAKTQQ
jgi:hypothetical protein